MNKNMEKKIYNENFLCNFLIRNPDILKEKELRRYNFSPMKENNPDLESDTKLYEVKLNDIEKGIGQSIRYRNEFKKEVILVGFFNKEIECNIKIINLNDNILFWKYYSNFLESKINNIWDIKLNKEITNQEKIEKEITNQEKMNNKNMDILRNMFNEKRIWKHNEMINSFFSLGGLGIPRYYKIKLNLERYREYIIKDITNEDKEKLKSRFILGRERKPYNKERVLKLIKENTDNQTELYRKICKSENVGMNTAIKIYKELS